MRAALEARDLAASRGCRASASVRRVTRTQRRPFLRSTVMRHHREPRSSRPSRWRTACCRLGLTSEATSRERAAVRSSPRPRPGRRRCRRRRRRGRSRPASRRRGVAGRQPFGVGAGVCRRSGRRVARRRRRASGRRRRRSVTVGVAPWSALLAVGQLSDRRVAVAVDVVVAGVAGRCRRPRRPGRRSSSSRAVVVESAIRRRPRRGVGQPVAAMPRCRVARRQASSPRRARRRRRRRSGRPGRRVARSPSRAAGVQAAAGHRVVERVGVVDRGRDQVVLELSGRRAQGSASSSRRPRRRRAAPPSRCR